LQHPPFNVAQEIGFDQGIGDACDRRRLNRKAKEERKALKRRDFGVGKAALPIGHPARVEAVHLADRPIGGEAVNGRHKLGDAHSHSAGKGANSRSVSAVTRRRH
jgi:hypothetical protein